MKIKFLLTAAVIVEAVIVFTLHCTTKGLIKYIKKEFCPEMSLDDVEEICMNEARGVARRRKA